MHVSSVFTQQASACASLEQSVGCYHTNTLTNTSADAVFSLGSNFEFFFVSRDEQSVFSMQFV